MFKYSIIFFLALAAFVMSSVRFTEVHSSQVLASSCDNPVTVFGIASHSDAEEPPLSYPGLKKFTSFELNHFIDQSSNDGSASLSVVTSLVSNPFRSLVLIKDEPFSFVTPPLFQLFSNYRL